VSSVPSFAHALQRPRSFDPEKFEFVAILKIGKNSKEYHLKLITKVLKISRR
jgi:hypothetical protein